MNWAFDLGFGRIRQIGPELEISWGANSIHRWNQQNLTVRLHARRQKW